MSDLDAALTGWQRTVCVDIITRGLQAWVGSTAAQHQLLGVLSLWCSLHICSPDFQVVHASFQELQLHIPLGAICGYDLHTACHNQGDALVPEPLTPVRPYAMSCHMAPVRPLCHVLSHGPCEAPGPCLVTWPL